MNDLLALRNKIAKSLFTATFIQLNWISEREWRTLTLNRSAWLVVCVFEQIFFSLQHITNKIGCPTFPLYERPNVFFA